MQWEQGRPVIEAMIKTGELQLVPASKLRADQLLLQANAHVTTALQVASSDPEGAYSLVYDAARKALVALLENQGLRPTSRAGHHGTYLAVRSQLDPPLGKQLRPFERLRRRRNEIEYPDFESPSVTSEDIIEDAQAAQTLIDLVSRVYNEMSPY
ncbi:MAG: HEPN domain-containing protein [Propionibacteriaceae bacterium]|nr:HEPN domain-containing protein [Propionibacteriaceae bacterium]